MSKPRLLDAMAGWLGGAETPVSPAVPDLEAPQPLDAETFQLWNVLAETALNTPEWKREDVRRLCATIRASEARVKALQDVADGARRWLSETGRVHVNSMVGRGRTRAALARLDALLGAEEGEG